MKKIICELCENTEFTKDSGMFICNSCGTKYTAEEARGMIREVEGISPAIAGNIHVGVVPTQNTNQKQLENILLLAFSSYEADNEADAEHYCNQAIVLDAMCYKAWFLKGRAIGWQSEIDNLRIEEAAHAFRTAIDFAPAEEKEDLNKQAVEELKNLGIALANLRKNRFASSPDTAELNGFTADKETILRALRILFSCESTVIISAGYLEQLADLMNQAGVAAFNLVRNVWENIVHPSENDFTTYLEWNNNICEMFCQAINTCDDDIEENIVRYENLICALKEPIGKCYQHQDWDAFGNLYWLDDYRLSQYAIGVDKRQHEISKCEQKIKELQKKLAEKKAAEERVAQEAKKARIREYWKTHADEKARLESEKEELTDKQDNLIARINELAEEIKETQSIGNVPSEYEADKIMAQIKKLKDKKASLGLFAVKEKRRVGEEIILLENRMDSLKSKIDAEKSARTAEVEKKVAPIKLKKDELDKQLSAVTQRLATIEAELTKDPEA